eukprot:GEZU01012468.1.p1 GENE.GEZU01012468.1~~GEZU01012468.1.p1  ORF type:complete len:134 (-),score=10.69 GEZU01012468.1:369-770(-)
MDTIQQEPPILGSLWNVTKHAPLIPLGMIATCGCLAAGIVLRKKRPGNDPIHSYLLFARIGTGLFTYIMITREMNAAQEEQRKLVDVQLKVSDMLEHSQKDEAELEYNQAVEKRTRMRRPPRNPMITGPDNKE